MTNNGPTTEKEQFAILDILRGLALLGIALANFPEFGLWTFLSAQEQSHSGVPLANIHEPPMAEPFLFRSSRVAMAHAHLRQVFPHNP